MRDTYLEDLQEQTHQMVRGEHTYGTDEIAEIIDTTITKNTSDLVISRDQFHRLFFMMILEDHIKMQIQSQSDKHTKKIGECL
jgi:hypothetical protein